MLDWQALSTDERRTVFVRHDCGARRTGPEYAPANLGRDPVLETLPQC